MTGGDFYGNEQSAVMPAGWQLKIEFVPRRRQPKVLKEVKGEGWRADRAPPS
jgi:monomeric isocitrate dehydrogenase